MNEPIEVQVAGIRSDLTALEKRVGRHDRWIDDISPEFHRKMNSFVDSYNGAEAMRDKLARERHEENIARMKSIDSRNMFWSVLIAVLGLICAICMVYLTAKSAGHAENDPAKLFHSENPSAVYAFDRQNADNPPPDR